MSKLIEIDIHDLAYDGKAVGKIDGKVVFLNGGLPGERVLAEITRRKARYDEARVREILTPSEERIPAVCKHFDYCGGCAWQDLAYERQLQYKQKQVADCLSRLAGLKEIAVKPIIGSTDTFFYRNKMEFSFLAGDDGNFTLGLHRRGRFDEIFDLQACHLESVQSNRIVRVVRDFVREHTIPVYDVRRHTGFMRFLVIREGKNTGQIMVNIVTNYGDLPHQTELIDKLTRAVPEITTVVHNQNGQKSNIAVGEKEIILFGPGYIEETILGYRFRIRANTFFQTNTHQAEKLYGVALSLLGPASDRTVLDLYCGGGAIGILAAARVRQVVGIESNTDAVRAARENAALNKCENISFIHGEVRRVLREKPSLLPAGDALIVDPPRSGLHPKALKRILELGVPKIIYISCNPATFARDAEHLTTAGYRAKEVQPVDMFPHTRHIELVSCFERPSQNLRPPTA